MQYVTITFQKYTYHNDGPPVAVGDKVKVMTKTGAEQEVQVIVVSEEKPPYDTKPIIQPK